MAIENFDAIKPSEEKSQIEDIYESTIVEHRALEKLSPERIKEFIKGRLEEINLLESVGEKNKLGFGLLPEVAKNIGIIWVFSGPGTYDQPRKEGDRYHGDWTDGMDRARLNQAARLSRKVTEVITGEKFHSSLANISQEKARIKEAIKEKGPFIIYNGTVVENEAVEKALARKGTVIPPEKVMVINGDIKRTVDQIRTFRLPPDFDIEGKEIALVSHAPHLVRIIRMINRHRPFPEGAKVRMFPLPTPKQGKYEYAKMEIRGLIYYIYLSRDHDATEDPYPYSINE